MATIAYTYDDKAVREDLLDILTNISPTETQLVSGLGQSKAASTLHEWLQDSLSAVKTNAYAEGVDASFPTITNPTRLFNYTQIFRQAYQVTDTERAVNTAAFADRFAYEATKAMKMLKNDMELAILRGSLSCGAANGTSAGARRLKGIKNWLSITTSQSGVSLTQAILDQYLQNVWDQGAEVTSLYVGAYIKRKVSGFMGNSTQKNIDVADKRLVNKVDVYEGDFGMQKLFKHRFATIAGDTNYDIVGVDDNLFRIAYLRTPFSYEPARTGDATKGEVITEATLECLSGYGGFLGQAHT